MQRRTFAALTLVLLSTTTTVRAEDRVRVCVNLKSGELRLLTTQSCPAGFTQADPSSAAQVPIMAFEHVDATADPALPGVCTPYNVGSALMGVVTTATDPVLANLRLPLRLK